METKDLTETQSLVISDSDLTGFLNQFRHRCGLKMKARYESNLLFGSKDIEIIHILRNEFDDIYHELCEQGVR